MKKQPVHFIFRKRGIGHNSIEELFSSIISNLPQEIDVNIVELPYLGASIKSLIGNIWHVLSLKGVIHITGDVNYIGLIPFKKTILTIHDVNFIKGNFFKRFLLKMIWIVLPSIFVKKITVVTEFSKIQLLKITPWVSSKINVINNAVNNELVFTQKKNNSTTRVLHLGTKKNKNLINTIKGLKGIQCTLVIVGKLSTDQLDVLKQNNTKYENYINLSFQEIKLLYEGCDIVSLISFYEGFGMPIIEAQKVGRPVIASREASIPEVAKDSVLYVDCYSTEDINLGFKKLIADQNLRDTLVNKGIRNVERFSMERIIKEYSHIYRTM